MYSNPINQTLKEIFEKINSKAIEKASHEFEILLESMNNMGHFQQLQKISYEFERITQLTEQNGQSYYINNAGSDS